MTNKIVILQNSVELYEHYINDEKWERTLSFPKGGLTYLISNGTIKFYAYEDYFYRNCLMSMQLPVYIVDEINGIDGEYSDVTEINEILDEIFPINDIDAELLDYLTKREAELTYQPIGDYALKSDIPVVDDFVTDEELVEALDDYYTKDEADARFQPIGDYLTKESGDTLYQPIGDYLTSADTYSKQEIDGKLDDKLDASAYTPCDLSNYYTKQETDNSFQPIGDYVNMTVYTAYTSTTTTDINNLKTDKLDVSAYTPFDPSSYYTKIEVDNLIISGGSFDPNQYYNKSESDNRFALKNEIPSLSGYATQEWVINKNYATRADFITYINNMQTQINSLIEAVSGCCETQEDVYRWLTIIGDYLCENNNKYEKQKYQVSHDGGIVWEDVTPIQYQKGQLLETDSADCGYVPDPQYRWKAAPTNDYLCSGTSKYYKVYYEVSYDGGQTWQHAVPEQTKRGDLIETNSTDCGYIEPQYRWKAAPQSDYLCSGTSKYYKVYYEVSYDNGSTWQHVQPEQTKRGDLIEANSTDCGYIAPQYRWYTSQSEYICNGTTKYQKQYYQVSYNNGQTWQNVSPTQTRTGSVIEYDSTDCGYVPPTPKFQFTLKNGSSASAACDSTNSIKQSETQAYSANTVSAVIGNCVETIGNWTFYTFHSLSSVTIPNTVTAIGYYGFGACDALSSITIPSSVITISGSAFAYCSGLTSVSIPNSVTSIGDSAFYDCRGLTSLTIGNSVTSIGDSAFNLCENLTSVNIPSSVSQIGVGAFNQCHRLATVTVRATTPPALGSGAFDETNLTSIKVPSASVNAYKTASGWSKYASIISSI